MNIPGCGGPSMLRGDEWAPRVTAERSLHVLSSIRWQVVRNEMPTHICSVSVMKVSCSTLTKFVLKKGTAQGPVYELEVRFLVFTAVTLAKEGALVKRCNGPGPPSGQMQSRGHSLPSSRMSPCSWSYTPASEKQRWSSSWDQKLETSRPTPVWIWIEVRPLNSRVGSLLWALPPGQTIWQQR